VHVLRAGDGLRVTLLHKFKNIAEQKVNNFCKIGLFRRLKYSLVIGLNYILNDNFFFHVFL